MFIKVISAPFLHFAFGDALHLDVYQKDKYISIKNKSFDVTQAYKYIVSYINASYIYSDFCTKLKIEWS